MTKPDWCPTDVWDASRNIQFHIPSGAAGPSQLAISQAIARAILAERDRSLEEAAAVAEAYAASGVGKAPARNIAWDIRALKETP